MRYIPRLLESELDKAAHQFPALIVTGPRRSGKTTMLRRLFPAAAYRLVEDPDVVAISGAGFSARSPISRAGSAAAAVGAVK